MSLKKKILAFLSSEEPQVVTLGEEKLENGTVLISEDFKEGMPIFIKSEDEDGENVKLPVGEYQMEDGRILKVEVEGEIASIEEAKIESEEETEEMEEEKEEVAMEEEEEKMEEVVYDEAHMEAMHKTIADLAARIEALEGKEQVMEVEEEEEYSEEEVTKMSSEEPKEEVKEEVAAQAAPEVEVAEEVAPIAHSPEVSDEKRVRFYFPKN